LLIITRAYLDLVEVVDTDDVAYVEAGIDGEGG
jgi:hypothetical protein